MISYNKVLPNGDRPVIWMPRTYRTDTGKPAVVFLTGTGTVWDAVFDRSVLLNVAEILTDLGFPLITSDVGINQFGNSRARSGIDDAVAYAQSAKVGVKAGPVHCWGFSQGGGTVLSYAANNPTKVLTVGGVCPLVDLNILIDLGDRTLLDAAYPPAYDESTMGASNNPQTMATAGLYGHIPMVLCSSSNDPVINPSKVDTFKSAVGASATRVDLGPVGHDNSVPLIPAAISALLTQIGA